jgi:hypothetical protein
MPEIRSTIQNHLPFKREGKVIEKIWRVSLLNPLKSDIKHRNPMVELTYNKVLHLAKRLYSSLDVSKRKVFERDYRHDNTESSLAMHTFITPNFYWHLECGLDYHYRIEYDFYNCQFEEELMKHVHRRELVTPGSCKQRQLKANCEEYFNRVIHIQDAHYTQVLPYIVINS